MFFNYNSLSDPVSNFLVPDPLIYETETIDNEFDIKVEQISYDLFSLEVDYFGTKIKKQLSNKDISKLQHELIIELFFKKTSDEKISLIEILNDGTDEITPDIIFKHDNNKYSVIELKTVRNNKNCYQKYEEGIRIYHDPCKKRSFNNFISLYSISVSKNKIVTNLFLDEEQASFILDIYNFSIKITNKFVSLGWAYIDTELKDRINKIKNSLSKMIIPDKSSDPLIIDKEKIKFWRESSKKNVYPIMKKEFQISEKNCVYENSRDNLLNVEIDKNEYYKKTIIGRVDMKSPVQLPMFLSSCIDMKSFDLHSSLTSETLLERTWKSAIDFSIFNQQRWTEIDESEMLRRAMNPTYFIQNKSEKKIHFRTQVVLDDYDWIELAKVGIEGKKKRNQLLVLNKKNKDKEPFSINCETFDIDMFINDKTILDMENNQNIINESFKPLLELASVSDNFYSKEFFMAFFKTKLGQMLTHLQLVLTEVNISRLQNCRKGEFILKKVPRINVFLLIKPSQAGEHIFFSIATPPGSFHLDKPFKSFSSFKGWNISDFVSMDHGRLSHQIATPERACSLYAFWCHQFETLPMRALSTNSSEDIRQHFLTSLLFYMEDKESTSSSLQNVRYAYMEMIKGKNRDMRPLKILSKISDRPRSRLLIWAIKRIILVFTNMCAQPPVFGLRDIELDDIEKTKRETANPEENDLDVSQDSCENLLSWVSLKRIPKFEIALNLSYFGVLHNKEEGNKIHGFLKIFEKIISEEIKLRDVNKDFCGLIEPELDHNYLTHEFSPTFIANCAMAVKKKLYDKGNGTYDWVYEKIYTVLAKKDMLDFATMKSSAMNIVNKKYEEDMVMNSRRRTTEGIYDLLQNGHSNYVFPDIDKLNDKVTKDGGLTANLFKKLQIGGTREIFVLSIESRLLVNYCESISRVFCEEMQNEMLTKGDQKLFRNDEHFKKLNDLEGLFACTVTSSDDASTWAQRFVMNAFGCFMANLLNDELLIPFCCILNHCTNKKLELPKELLQLFLDHSEIKSFSDNINELSSQFLGKVKTNNDLVDTRHVCLKNKSNMMQGIFHYTSSILHSGVMNLWQRFSELALEKRFSRQKEDFIITTKVSSDDSSIIISTRTNNQKKKYEILKFFQVLCDFKSRLYKFFCSKQSIEKSTVGAFYNIEEFNSTWLMRNTLIMPLIKFVVSSVQMHVDPRLEGRFFTNATLRSQVLENCGSYMLTSIIQLCQMRLHYIALGCFNNKLWYKFQEILCKKPHTSSGFMTLEPDIMCGALGMDFANYLFYKSNKKSWLLQQKLFKNFGVDYDVSGSPTSRIFLTYGQNTKYYSFLNNIGLKNKVAELENIDKKLKDNVQLLYRQAENSSECLIKLIIKSSSPEIAQAFSFLDSSKVFASSVYLIQDSCFHFVTRKKDNEDLDTISKMSLLKWASDLEPDDDFNENLFLTNFPAHEFYDSLYEKISKLNLNNLHLTARRRRIFISTPIPKSNSITPMSLMDACKRIWFNIDVKGSESSSISTFDHYKKIYKWLSKNYNETFEDSPFESHITLMKFLSSLMPSSKTIRLTTSSRPKHSIIQTLIDSVVKNQWPNHQISLDETQKFSESSLSLDSLIQTLWLAKHNPHQSKKMMLIEKACKYYPDFIGEKPNMISITTQGEMKFNAMITQNAILHPEMTISILKKYNRGVFGGFVVPQKYDKDKNDYVGYGLFSGSIDNELFMFEIDDSFVTRLVVQNKIKFIKKMFQFKNFIQDMDLSLKSKKTQGEFIGFRDLMTGTWAENKVKIEESIIGEQYFNRSVYVDCDNRGKIRIKTSPQSITERSITIFSYVPSVKFTVNDYKCVELGESDYSKKWMDYDVLSRQEALNLLSDDTLKDVELSKWVYTSLIRKLLSIGINVVRVRDDNELPLLKKTENLLEIDSQSNIEEDFFKDFDELGISIDKEIYSSMFLPEDQYKDEDEIESELLTEIEGVDKIISDMFYVSDTQIVKQPIRLKNESDVFQLHPFWNEYINYLLRFSNSWSIEAMINGQNVQEFLVLEKCGNFLKKAKKYFD